MDDFIRELTNRLTKELVDQGLLIEAGWYSFRNICIHPNASQAQLDEMRMAFMTGAQHLFSSIMVVTDPGVEATEQDFKRFDMIQKELDRFAVEIKTKIAALDGFKGHA